MTLRFFSTPFLHWPDTQCTLIEERNILFSGDVFGCHFCDARLFNDQVGDFRFSFEYYYAHIMRPFREHVLDALELLEPLPLKLIAPAHGPILREAPLSYMQRYRQLAAPLLHNEVGPAINHCWFLHLFLRQYRAHGASRRRGCRDHSRRARLVVRFASGGNLPFVDLIEEADGLAFGSPTINGDAVKPVWDLLSSLVSIKVSDKLGAAFGSYGWSGEAINMIEDRLRGLKLRVPVKGVRAKLIPTEEELERCRDLGKQLAQHLPATSIHRR